MDLEHRDCRGVIVSVLISYATNGTTGLTKFDPRTWFVVRSLLAYPLQTAVGLIVASVVTTCAYLAHLSHQRALRASVEHHVPTLTIQNRQRMLAKVRSFWINGVLQKSLHGAALITLGMEEQPDAIENPWRLIFQQPDQVERTLPPGTHITQVYDDAGGELLILGEPGSGKTTLLLELASDLLDRAERDEKHPIPVVFNLASWVEKRLSLAEWLVEELNSKYQVPHKLGQLWMDSDQVLLLLDGLDEVIPLYRTACMDAINNYRGEHGLMPTVVCCRSADYLVQKKGLMLRNAVVVQPLTAQQIDDYLASAGGKLASVRVALRNDSLLLKLVTTPLMLSILTIAYCGKSVEDLVAANFPTTQQRQQVIETYIERTLQRRSSKSRFTRQKTVIWLAGLANHMKKHHQTDFYIESMQQDWLSKSR